VEPPAAGMGPIWVLELYLRGGGAQNTPTGPWIRVASFAARVLASAGSPFDNARDGLSDSLLGVPDLRA